MAGELVSSGGVGRLRCIGQAEEGLICRLVESGNEEPE